MIIANWKCNGSKSMISEWFSDFSINYIETNELFIGIAPPSIYIENVLSNIPTKLIGVNINFAPVVDINFNPENPIIGNRSFGENPIRVGELGVQSVSYTH